MDEIIYITPSGIEVSEQNLREKYGDEKFEEFVSSGQFILKKKDNTELESEDGSSEQVEFSQDDLEVLEKDFGFPETNEDPQQTNVVDEIPEALSEEEVEVTVDSSQIFEVTNEQAIESLLQKGISSPSKEQIIEELNAINQAKLKDPNILNTEKQRSFLESKGVDVDAMLKNRKFGNKATTNTEAEDIDLEYNTFINNNASQDIQTDFTSTTLKPVIEEVEEGLEIKPTKVSRGILDELKIDVEDFSKWEANTQREESLSFQLFKKSASEEGQAFKQEKKDTEKILSYKMKVMESLRKDIDTIDSRLQIATNPKDQLQLLNIKKELEAKLTEESNLLSKMGSLFPTYKEFTYDLDLQRRKRIYEASQEGGAVRLFTELGETAKTIPVTISNFALGSGAAITSLLDQALTGVGADKKGVLAGITEMLLDAGEAIDIEIGPVKRSGVTQGKNVTVEGIQYVVTEEGDVLDPVSNVSLVGIISDEKFNQIKKRAENVKFSETNYSGGALVQGGIQTLANLFALIKGGQALSKSLGVSGGTGMGLASYASTSAQSVEDMRSDLVSAGLTEDEALNKAAIAGNAIATLDGVFSGLAGSNTKVLSNLTGFKTAIINAVKKDGKKFTVDELKRKAKDLAKENMKELFIEELPVLFSEKAISAAVNELTGLSVRSSSVKSSEIMETVIMTLGATTTLGSVNLLSRNRRLDALRYVARNVSDLDKTVTELVRNNNITEDQGKKVYQEIYAMQTAENRTKGTIVDSENMLEVSDLLNQRQRLVEQKEGLEGPLKEDQDKRIADVDEQIKQAKERDSKESQSKETIDSLAAEEGSINIENPSAPISFEYDSEEDIPESLKLIEPKGKGFIEIDGKKKVRLTYSGQQLIDAGIGVQSETVTTKKEDKKTDLVKEEKTEDVSDTKDDIIINDSSQRMELMKESKNNPESVKIKLAKAIKKYLPKGKTYTQGVVNRLNKLVSKVETEEDFEVAIEKVMNEVDKQVKKQKDTTLKKILKLVKSKAKGTPTVSGRKTNKGIDAEGQSFFSSIERIINAAINSDINAMAEISNELSDLDNIDQILIKESDGEKLNVDEEKLLNQVLAFDTLGDIANMSLEEVNVVLESLKDVKKESIIRFKENRQKRVDEKRKFQQQAGKAVEERNPDLINKDGKAKDANEIEQDKNRIAAEYKKKGILGKLSTFLTDIVNKGVDSGFKNFTNYISNLATITKALDTATSSFFYDNIYRPLARQDEVYNRGVLDQENKIKELQESIEGFDKEMLIGEVKIDGIKNKEGAVFSKEQALRIYSLYQNPVQKNKLQKQGFTDSKMESIKEQLGPEAIAYADSVIEYLSSEYYDTINGIYKKNNDINLTKLENYFPVKTLSQKEASDIISGQGGFSQVFNQTTISALKERVDKTGDIDLTQGFSDVLENHTNSMEKYKAYADVVVSLNNLFNSKKVEALVNTLGVKSMIEKSINGQINPSSVDRAFSASGITTRFANSFTKYALSYKFIQLIKQASSFITAFETYKFKPKSNALQDATMFMVDGLKLALQLPKILYTKDNPINKAMDMSASFKRRVLKGLEGDVYGLESGSETMRQIKNPSKIRKALNNFVKFGTYPTIIGDVLGVMGYMINYERDIKNGMSEAEALEKFNDYNQSQQSRRAIDKSGIQMPGDTTLAPLSRGFTMFGSTLFLYLNKVAQTSRSITRDVLKGGPKNVKSKDVKGLMIYYGVANALFTAVSNIAKIGFGDDEDKDEVLKSIKDSMKGAPLLYQIPIMGEAIELAVQAVQKNKVAALKEELKNLKGPYQNKRAKKIKEEIETYPKKYYPTNQFLNPIGIFVNKGSKVIKDGFQYRDALSVLEAIGGVQLDPFVGLYNVARGLTGKEDDEDFDLENSTYDLLGISPSYRPKNEIQARKDKKASKPLTIKQQKELKRRNPEKYNKFFGKESEYYKRKQRLSKARAERKKR